MTAVRLDWLVLDLPMHGKTSSSSSWNGEQRDGFLKDVEMSEAMLVMCVDNDCKVKAG